MWANVSLGQEELRINHAALVRLEGFGFFWAEWCRSGLSSDDKKTKMETLQRSVE